MLLNFSERATELALVATVIRITHRPINRRSHTQIDAGIAYVWNNARLRKMGWHCKMREYDESIVM